MKWYSKNLKISIGTDLSRFTQASSKPPKKASSSAKKSKSGSEREAGGKTTIKVEEGLTLNVNSTD